MKKYIIKILTICSFLIVLTCAISYAQSSNLEAYEEEVTEEYKKWLELSDEEKLNTLEPKKYYVEETEDTATSILNTTNVFRQMFLINASLESEYSLVDYIPENVRIRNQRSTNGCWAFAALGVLESHLGLKDFYKNGYTTYEYDFSELHMMYASSKNSVSGDYKYGYNIDVSYGGNFNIASQYMLNGLGTVNESDMAFSDYYDETNNKLQETVDESVIMGAEVESTLYDAVSFESLSVDSSGKYDSQKLDDIKNKIKQHIKESGGVYAGIYGANATENQYYNNDTGAMYCDDSNADLNHAVVIVGWDDDYSKDNFNKEKQPSDNGAWIVKNSWGEDFGDNGFMYISYEDYTVYKYLYGITKATDSKDYNNVYQHDIQGATSLITFNNGDGYLNLANVFERDTSNSEALNRLTLMSLNSYTVKVYVNASDGSFDNLTPVTLTEGETKTLSPGYNSLEFSTPIELTGDEFVVVVQIMNEGSTSVLLEKHYDENIEGLPDLAKGVEVNEGESFVSMGTDLSNVTWEDLKTKKMNDSSDIDSNLLIKGYTVDYEKEESSGFDNINNITASIVDAKLYFDSNNTNNVKGSMTIKVSGIEITENIDSYKYYYFLSGTYGDTNIEESSWKETELILEDDGTYSLLIDINSEELENYNLIIEEENLFLYLKEVKTLSDGSMQENEIVLEVILDVEVEYYVDETQYNIEDILNYNSSNTNDPTVFNGILPNAGMNIIIIIGIIVLVAISGFSLYKYKNIDR